MRRHRGAPFAILAALAAPTGCSFLVSLDELSEGTPLSGNGEAGVASDGSTGGVDSGRADAQPPSDASPLPDGSVPQFGCDAPQTDPTLVAYWAFDEGTGTTVKDCTKSGIDGVLVGSAKWTTGKHGGAIAFDGVSSCVDFGVSNSADLPAFTFMAWAKVQTYAGSGGINGYLIGRTTDPNGLGWRFASDAPSILEFKIGATPTPFTSASPTGQPAGTWAHVAVVYEASKRADVYVDGKLVRSTTPTVPIVTDTTAKLLVGCNNGQKDYFVGALDDVRIYSRVLTAAEIGAAAK